MISCNTQGAEGAWSFYRNLDSFSPPPDVILLQEISFSLSHASSFRSSLLKSSFNLYFQQGTSNRRRVNGNKLSGGVAILVRKDLDQKFAFSKCGDFSQSIYVWVNGCIFGSVYAPPYADSPAEAAAQFLDLHVSCEVPCSSPWFIGGDFNEEPGQSHFENICSAWHGSAVRLGEPTRWNGRREIDFFITNHPEAASTVKSLDFVIGDHKILSSSFLCPSRTSETFSYRRGPKFPKPDSCEPEVWRDLVSHAWDEVEKGKQISSFIGNSQIDIQLQWDILQQGLCDACIRAYRHVSPHTKFSPSQVAAKGAVATFIRRSQPVKKAQPELGYMAERKLRRRLARHYALIRFKKMGIGLTPAQLSERDSLARKLGFSMDVPILTILQESNRLSRLLRQMEENRKCQALAAWRSKMSCDTKAVSRWLKAKNCPTTCAIRSNNGVCLNLADGAQAIHDFWTNFWQDLCAQRPSLDDRTEALLAGVPAKNPVQFDYPTGVQLMARAQNATGGPSFDGWDAGEIKFFPLQVFDLIASFFLHCIETGQIPKQFLQSRMICLPKTDKLENYQISAADCRPITILSTFWRLWCSTMCQSPGIKQWLHDTLSPQVSGLTGTELYTTIIMIFDHLGTQNFILGMDYTKAFDVLDPRVTQSLLKKYGWPEKLIRLLVMVWSHNERFVCWGHHTHPHPLQGPSMPQGDPWGPLICSLWVQAGVSFLHPPGILTSTYLDDRCIVSDTSMQLQQQYDRWSDWSRSVGLLENGPKTVVSGRLKRHVSALHRVFPGQYVKGWIRVLGACTASSMRSLCPVEESRIASALRTADLLGTLGVGFSRCLQLLRAFALSKANFGWIGRAPTWTASSKLWTRCWSSAGRARFSSPWVRCLLYGGNLHLDVTWATVLVGAIVRGHSRYSPVWSLRRGTASFALHSWLLSKGWSLVRPWVWSHHFAQVRLDLTACAPSLVSGRVGLAQHNIRMAWRAWCWEKWVASGRHELRSLNPSPVAFRSMSWSSIRSWGLSSGAANTVALGATVSPACFKDSQPELSLCPWPGCSCVRYWDHLVWSCPFRPSSLRRPRSPWLARLGWSMISDCPTEVAEVQAWLCRCQLEIWKVRHGPGSE